MNSTTREVRLPTQRMSALIYLGSTCKLCLKNRVRIDLNLRNSCHTLVSCMCPSIRLSYFTKTSPFGSKKSIKLSYTSDSGWTLIVDFITKISSIPKLSKIRNFTLSASIILLPSVTKPYKDCQL